ncbi:MAG: hypothetical protein R6W31_07545 [Bacteroidales bacterium]
MLQKNNLIALFLLSMMFGCNTPPRDFEQTGETLEIYPDYTSITIPWNIAPLNFHILNKGDLFVAEISNSQNRKIVVKSGTGSIEIPMRSWKRLLKGDRDGALTIKVYKKSKGGPWEALAQVKNEISEDEIDPYIAFRKIAPANIVWGEMGIYQRSLETFEETPIMVNTLTDKNCINCHTFNTGDPEQMLFHMRGPFGGTMVADKENISFVDTKTDQSRAAGAYASWHPGGELIAFSVNQISQSFHSRIGKLYYVVDKYSDIVLYDVKSNSITRPAELATEKLENLPSWSYDGQSLYYLLADKSYDTLPYDLRAYNLMNIRFDEKTRKFGQSDTLISTVEFGRSITHPRESPSGGMVSFIGVNYGYFSIYNKDADLYLYNKKAGTITKPEINSEFAESYPSWSCNGSWLMFVSKRDDGHFSQVWFSHMDENGSAGKPFVLPQKDPDFYKDYLYNYNRPEFISGKVKQTPRQWLSIARTKAIPSTFDEASSVTISSGATSPANPEDAATDHEYYHHD